MILLKRRTTDQLQNRRQTSGTIRINWQQGNFDGDGDSDITDFHFLAASFNPTGYGPGSASPAVLEPAGAVLAMLAMLLFMACTFKKALCFSERLQGQFIQ